MPLLLRIIENPTKRKKRRLFKAVSSFLEREAEDIKVRGKIANIFIPGIGKVSDELSDAYKSLAKGDRSAFFKLRGKNMKADRIEFLKQFLK